MEVISKEILESIDSWDYETPQQLIMDIIDKCKELPDQQWQTIDEFKANTVDGWCWLIHKRFNNRTVGHYSIGRFWIDGGICQEEHITHVMPIKTPEAPK